MNLQFLLGLMAGFVAGFLAFLLCYLQGVTDGRKTPTLTPPKTTPPRMPESPVRRIEIDELVWGHDEETNTFVIETSGGRTHRLPKSSLALLQRQVRQSLTEWVFSGYDGQDKEIARAAFKAVPELIGIRRETCVCPDSGEPELHLYCVWESGLEESWYRVEDVILAAYSGIEDRNERCGWTWENLPGLSIQVCQQGQFFSSLEPRDPDWYEDEIIVWRREDLEEEHVGSPRGNT